MTRHSPDVDPDHLRGLEDAAERPHERPVDPHHLVGVDHVGLVEHDPDLLLVEPQRLEPNSTEKFRLEKSLLFWPEIPYSKKMLKNG